MKKSDLHQAIECRFDMTMKVIGSDEATSTLQMVLEPDPRRYTPVERDGEKWFLDKYLHELVPLKAFVDQMKGLPMYHLSSSIDSTPDYASRRKDAVAHELRTGEYVPPVEAALSHESFSANQTKRSVSFLSVDVCGGTALRRSNPEAFEHAYRIMISELGTAVGQFKGTIVKLTGDGFIACVDHPSFTSLCDMTIDLGLSMLSILKDSVNLALVEGGLPALHVRIGADFGEAEFRPVAVRSTGFADIEIASDALNRAVKIQESCDPDEFRIGYTLYRLVHVQWLERATEVQFDGSTVGIEGYKSYRMR